LRTLRSPPDLKTLLADPLEVAIGPVFEELDVTLSSLRLSADKVFECFWRFGVVIKLSWDELLS
jgi:hypothetical protein